MAISIVFAVMLVVMKTTGLPTVCIIDGHDDENQLQEMKRVWCLLEDKWLGSTMTDPSVPSLDYKHIEDSLDLRQYNDQLDQCVRFII